VIPTCCGRHLRARCGAVKDILAAVDGGVLLTPDSLSAVPLASWGSGPITLLGDAAHASVPHAAQGSSMGALRTGLMLGAMAKRFAADGVERVFREYEARRIPRTTKALVMALNNLVYFTESDPRRAPGPASTRRRASSRWTRSTNGRGGWLYHYDGRGGGRQAHPRASTAWWIPRFEETDRLTEGWLST